LSVPNIANELEHGVYHVDLAAVVSKDIGETEKNLKRLFDAANTTAPSSRSMRQMYSSADATRCGMDTTATPTSW
jgi:AAA+ superfamily predicted ATPase